MNFKRPPFQRPQITSFAKSDRVYPDSKKLETKCPEVKNQMSQQKSKDLTPQKKISAFNTTKGQNIIQPQIITHDTLVDKYFFLSQDTFDPNAQQGDPNFTVLWSVNIGASTKKRMLVTKDCQYVISNWSGDSFPNLLYLGFEGFGGYKDASGNLTNLVAALVLTDIQAVLDDSNIRTYQLRYVLKNPTSWTIPQGLTQLEMRMYQEDGVTVVVPPLPNPIALNFQLRNLGV